MRHLPNLICLLRIALVWPVVQAIASERYWLALVLMALAAMVDKGAKMGMVLVAIARAAHAFGDVLSGSELW